MLELQSTCPKISADKKESLSAAIGSREHYRQLYGGMGIIGIGIIGIGIIVQSYFYFTQHFPQRLLHY